jgi:hypothetical protein
LPAVTAYCLEPWEEIMIGDVRIAASPARHGVPEITFVLQAGDVVVFLGGDMLRILKLGEVARPPAQPGPGAAAGQLSRRSVAW